MRVRVSNIEAYRQWLKRDDQSVEDLIDWITNSQQSEAMAAGTAFHAAMETITPGEYSMIEHGGYTFYLPDDEIALPDIRELRQSKRYGGITVSGQVDAIQGTKVIDHKTTKRFDAERFLSGAQWKFYLDIFEADVFQWNVFELKPDRKQEHAYYVQPHKKLTQFRYPGLHGDCVALAAQYENFYNEFMKQEAA